MAGLCYASSPWLLAGVIKHQLAGRGFTDIQLQVDYPKWRGFQLHSLVFTMVAGEQQVLCEIPDIEVRYQLTELLTGTVARIRLPVVALRILPALGSAPSAPSASALPLVTLLSGQWLAQLPVSELLLEQLSITGRTSANTIYTLQLRGQLRDAQLQVNGDIRLPAPQQPIAFSLSASHTGAAHVFIAPLDHATAPLLELTVNPVARDHDPLELSGVLDTKLTTLMPMVSSSFADLKWAAGLEGVMHSQWQAQVADASWQIAGEVTVHDLGGRWHDQVLPRGELTAKFDLDSQRAKLQSRLRVAEKSVVLEAEGIHEFVTGHGHADLKLLPVVFSDSGFVLSRLLTRWPWKVDITTGQASGSGRLVWQKAIELQGILQLDKIGGHYNQLVFTGLSAELALANGAGLHTTKDVQLRVAVVDVGFPIEKIAVHFALVPQPKSLLPLLRLRSVSAELLGGKMLTGPFEFDFSRNKNAFVVQLEGIGLNEIMQLEQQEGLQGSGVLDGQLPIVISSAGIVVIHGQLTAREPGGEIRYTPTSKVAAMAESNTSVKVMVQALSHFQYDLLNVGCDYKPGGDLALQVRLEGKNADLQGGQPIHFNLNLEENIPTLLRSLQLSDDIREQVSKRYQNTPPGKVVQ